MKKERVVKEVLSGSSSGLKKRLSKIFWISFLILSLSYAWYCFYAPSNDVAWVDNYTAAKEQSIESGKPMILFFTASWCSPCQIMKRTIWADSDIASEVNAHYVPVMLYAGDPEADKLFAAYEVGMTPITILTNPDGSVIDYAVGKVNKPDFLRLITQKIN